MGHLDNHAHTYEIVRNYLTQMETIDIIHKIQTSGRFRVDELSHIILKDTDICVGYIGEDTAELVDVERKDISSQRKHLKRIFYSVKPAYPEDIRKSIEARQTSKYDGQRLEYIRQIVSILSGKASNVSLLQEYLVKTADAIRNLKKKEKAIRNEHISNVKNPLIGYEGLWGEEALKDLGGRFKHDREHMGYSHYRELFFKDIRYRSKLRKISDKISSLNDRYVVTLNLIKTIT